MSVRVSDPQPRARVLFADDDPGVRAAIAHVLRKRGLIVDLAIDGAEALALAREFPYSVIATDLRMPKLSGRELIEALEEVRPEAAFVIITGALDALDEIASRARVHSVIPKPWTEEGLVSTIESAVLEAHGRTMVRSPSSATFIAHGGLFLLVLEDNDLDARMLERSIERVAPGAFRMVRARTLAEASRFLRGRPYSAVLADVGLPDSNGLATLKGLLGASPDTPILVITGAEDESLALEAVRAGAQDYLLKGAYDPQVVLRSIRYAVERKRIQIQLSELAHHDTLTGVANRILLMEREKHALSRAKRSGRHMALLAVDLDHFKTINDRYGHEAGDLLLVEVAQRLVSSTRSGDTVARIGGDEFMILLEELDSHDGARRVVQRVHNAFATPMEIDGKRLVVTPSVGIALFPDDAADLRELQRHADSALYAAKRAGRNAAHFYSPELHERARKRRELEQDLVGALEAGRFELAYLPEVDLRSGAVCGYEALLRWNRAPGQVVPAGDFLNVLDESGELVRVGKWVLGRVCTDAVDWQLAAGMRLSINVSGRELATPDFVASVENTLGVHGIDGESLELELTEQSLATHFEDAKSKLSNLAALGVTLAVDGYGAGRSSIIELAELPIRTLKLHESLTHGLQTGEKRAALSAVLGVATALGWSLVAKRVETREQLELVRRLGCLRAQGRFCGAAVSSPGFSLAGTRTS